MQEEPCWEKHTRSIVLYVHLVMSLKLQRLSLRRVWKKQVGLCKYMQQFFSFPPKKPNAHFKSVGTPYGVPTDLKCALGFLGGKEINLRCLTYFQVHSWMSKRLFT